MSNIIFQRGVESDFDPIDGQLIIDTEEKCMYLDNEDERLMIGASRNDLMTYDEYKELPDEKLTDNKLRIITDINNTDESSVAQHFDGSSNYNKGEYILVNGSLEKAKENVTAGAYDPTEWENTTVGVELETINSNLTELDGRVEELENKTNDWSLVGTVNGATPVTLPSAWKEALIYVYYTNDINSRGFSFYVNRSILALHKTFQNGWFNTGSSNSLVSIRFNSETEVKTQEVKGESADQINSCAMTVYTR